VAVRHNSCVNPALKNNANGWGDGGAEVPTRVSASAGSPRPFAALYSTNSAGFVRGPEGAVTPGVPVTISVHIKPTNSGSNGTMYAGWINSGGGEFGYDSSPYPVVGGSFNRVEITKTPPAEAVAVRMILDGVNFEFNPTEFTAAMIGAADSYFDGDTAGAVWDGADGNSSSTLDDAPPTPEGNGLATLALSASSDGEKRGSGAGAVSLVLTSASDGQKRGGGSGSVVLFLGSSSDGQKVVVSSADPVLLQLTALSDGQKIGAGDGAVTLPLSASGTGEGPVSGSGVAVLGLSAVCDGSKVASGAPEQVHLGMAVYSDGTKRAAGLGSATLTLLVMGSGGIVTGPEALRYIRLTGTWTKGGGPTLATGWVRLMTWGTTLAPGADTVVSSQPLDVKLVNGALVHPGDGLPGIPVLDPGDPDLEHSVYVELHVLLDDTEPQSMLLDISTPNDTIDVADAILLDPPDPDSRHDERIPWSARGAVNGVAPLNAARKIPPEFLPPVSGGTPAFEFVQNTPQSVVTVFHEMGFRPNVSVFSLDWSDQYDEFEVQHLSANELRVSMDTPTACVLVLS
jgi:hypothetical protein